MKGRLKSVGCTHRREAERVASEPIVINSCQYAALSLYRIDAYRVRPLVRMDRVPVWSDGCQGALAA